MNTAADNSWRSISEDPPWLSEEGGPTAHRIGTQRSGYPVELRCLDGRIIKAEMYPDYWFNPDEREEELFGVFRLDDGTEFDADELCDAWRPVKEATT